MMTDDQKKLANIIEEKLQSATAEIRCEIEKEIDDQVRDEDMVEVMDSFYHMDNQFDKLARRYGRAIAMRSNAVTVGNLIDHLTGTNS